MIYLFPMKNQFTFPNNSHIENNHAMDNESDQIEQPVNEQALVKKTIKIFAELCDAMPPIGFFSRKKRVSAYITVTSKAQSLIDSNQSNDDEILFVFSLMVRKKKDFHKMAMMAALCLPKMATGLLTPIGFKYANDVRANMQLGPVNHENSIQI